MNEILFIGYSARHPADFEYTNPEGSDFYLLLLITSPAEIMIAGKMQYVTADTAILFPPGYPIYYRACDDVYTNDWIRFTSDETFVTKFPLQGVPFSVSDTEYCHSLFKLLTWESSFSSGNSELIISSLLRALFLKLNEDSANSLQNPHLSSLLALRKQIYNKPQKEWKISSMARELHISPGYLQLLYKKTFGISCMDDVIEGRLRLAKDQLIYTGKTTAEIADFCGYKNVEHFCRQFKQNASLTPSEYRRLHAQPLPGEAPRRATVTGSILKHPHK